VKTGYRGSATAEVGKTRPDLDATHMADRTVTNQGAFDPGKTVPLSTIKRTPVVGWLVALNSTQKGEDFRLREGKNALGSDPTSEIVLRDPAVSGKHASINYKDGKFVITDLDSTNGTYINEDAEPVARIELKDNDVIRIGETTLKFKCL
jgi:hypothetical protein